MIYLRRRLAAFLSMGALTAGLRGAYGLQPEPPPNSTVSGSSNALGDKTISEQIMDDFNLSFELKNVGWAHARVSVGSATRETEVSYLTRDPLGQLAQALIAFIWPEDTTVFVFRRPQAKIDPQELRTHSFTWEDEPGGWQWTLRPHGSTAVKVKLQPLSSQSAGPPIIDSVCALQGMARACTSCIEGLLLNHGIVGYHMTWVYGDLPLAEYLLLKRWLQSPQYVAKTNEKSVEVGTWHEDLAALRLLGS